MEAFRIWLARGVDLKAFNYRAFLDEVIGTSCPGDGYLSGRYFRYVKDLWKISKETMGRHRIDEVQRLW